MNVVYLVCNYDGEDTQILKVFDTEEKAQKYIAECEAEEDAWIFYENLYIDVREVI